MHVCHWVKCFMSCEEGVLLWHWFEPGLEEVKCEMSRLWRNENIFVFLPCEVFPLDKSAGSLAEVWRWWHLWYLSSEANTDTSEAADACNPVKVTISSSSLLRKFWQCWSFQQWLMCCTCLYHYVPILCCFVRYPPTKVSPHAVLSWQALYQVIAPLFWDTLSLMRKTLYKHPAYLCLFCSFSDLSLIRYCSLWDIAIRRKLVIFQASSWLDISIWRNPGNIVESRRLQSMTWHVLFQNLGDLQPNKGSKWSPVLW